MNPNGGNSDGGMKGTVFGAEQMNGQTEQMPSLEQLQNMERRTEMPEVPEELAADLQGLGQQTLTAAEMGMMEPEKETQEDVLQAQAAAGIGTDLTAAVDQDGVDKVWEAKMDQLVSEVKKDPRKAVYEFAVMQNKFISDRYGWSWKDNTTEGGAV